MSELLNAYKDLTVAQMQRLEAKDELIPDQLFINLGQVVFELIKEERDE